MHATPRTAIIGAGISGLTAAKKSSCTVRLPWSSSQSCPPTDQFDSRRKPLLLTAYTAEFLTPDLITSMLRASGRYDGVTVDSLNVTAIGTGQMAASYRLDITYAAAVDGALPVTMSGQRPSSRPTTETNDTQPPGRPPRLCVNAVCGSDSWRSPAAPRN
jgi:hypothetical protein